ncbi:MAG: hypothetical protein V4617_11340 [Gemmatimonadota bacterium]
MFSTCIHCTAALGSNQAIEAFPVGERLAFDLKRGRLWVVCRQCERWNLSPLDERWEAIEEAERRFRDTRLRVSTDEIGLARLREGLDLIRIGEPQRPEMAAWRYGNQFGRRRKRQLLITGAVGAAVLSVFGAVMAAGASAGAFTGVYANPSLWDRLIHGSPGKVVARVLGPDGEPLTIQRRHARMTTLERSDGANSFWMQVQHTKGMQLVHGADAMRIAAQLLPVVNRFGASRRGVQDAVALLEEAGDPARVLNRVQQQFGARSSIRVRQRATDNNKLPLSKIPGALHTLPARERLALEMALHEESERRAMDGELDTLATAWREAEEIAAIADGMFDTADTKERLAQLRVRAVPPDARTPE